MVAILPTPSDSGPEARTTFLSASGDIPVSTEQKPRKKLDKQSVEYVLKSGLAGGLAGCAVCKPITSYVDLTSHVD